MIIKSYFSKQFVFFLVVGTLTFLIDLAVTAAVFYLLGLPAYFASGVGFLSGFLFNFPLNRRKVFQHNEKYRFGLQVQIFSYFILSAFNLFTTSFMVGALVDSEYVTIGFAKVLATGLIAAWNFLIFKFVIFSKAE